MGEADDNWFGTPIYSMETGYNIFEKIYLYFTLQTWLLNETTKIIKQQELVGTEVPNYLLKDIRLSFNTMFRSALILEVRE